MQLNLGITWSHVFQAYVLIDDYDGCILIGESGPLSFDTKKEAFEWALINHKKVSTVSEFVPGQKGEVTSV